MLAVIHSFIIFPFRYSLLTEIGGNINDTMGHMKETIVESAEKVTNSINEVVKPMTNGTNFIPLNDAMESLESNHMIEENLENMKNDLLTKAQTMSDETDKMADELIKETEDVIRDAETGMVDIQNEVMEGAEAVKTDILEAITNKSPSHSQDSLKTSMPEPEIERLLNDSIENNPPSPEATTDELENLNNEATADSLEAQMDNSLSAVAEPTAPKEEELIVEDVKSDE